MFTCWTLVVTFFFALNESAHSSFFASFLVLFPVLNLALFRAVVRAFALRTLFHLAPFITRITSISINCGLPTIFFKTIIAMARAVVLFAMPFLKAFAVRQVFNTFFLRVCFERLFAKWAPHHSRTTLDSISVHGARKQQILPALLRCGGSCVFADTRSWLLKKAIAPHWLMVACSRKATVGGSSYSS